MPRRAPATDKGRRSTLTRDLADKIVTAVRAGNYLGPAARQYGVPESTLWQWMQQGDDATQRLHRGEQLPPQARIYAQFAEAVTRARARAETNVVAVVTKVIEGGYLLEEEPALNGDGLPIYDKDGEPLMRRKYAPPDGKLGMEYLRRSFPQRWAPADEGRDETAAGGAAAGAPAAVSQIVDRLALFAARRSEEAELDPEDVVEGEVVADDASPA